MRRRARTRRRAAADGDRLRGHHVNDGRPTLLSAAWPERADARDAHAELAPSQPPLLMGDGIDNWHVPPRGAPSRRTDDPRHASGRLGAWPEPEPEPEP